MLKKIFLLLSFISAFNTSFSQSKQMAADIARLKSECSVLTNKVTTLESNINSLMIETSAIPVLGAKVEVLTNKVTTLEARVTALSTDLEKLRVQIANLIKKPVDIQPIPESKIQPQGL